MADQVPPTRMALQTYKTKRTGATKGHQLLKKKADALKARFQGIAKEIYATKATMADACVIPQLDAAMRLGLDLSPFERLVALHRHCQS